MPKITILLVCFLVLAQQYSPANLFSITMHSLNYLLQVIDMPEHNPGQMGGTMRLGKRRTIFQTKNSVMSMAFPGPLSFPSFLFLVGFARTFGVVSREARFVLRSPEKC